MPPVMPGPPAKGPIDPPAEEEPGDGNQRDQHRVFHQRVHVVLAPAGAHLVHAKADVNQKHQGHGDPIVELREHGCESTNIGIHLVPLFCLRSRVPDSPGYGDSRTHAFRSRALFSAGAISKSVLSKKGMQGRCRDAAATANSYIRDLRRRFAQKPMQAGLAPSPLSAYPTHPQNSASFS